MEQDHSTLGDLQAKEKGAPGRAWLGFCHASLLSCAIIIWCVQLPKLHGRVAKGIPDCVRGTVWKLIVNARGVQKELGFSYPVRPPFRVLVDTDQDGLIRAMV
jgi:hypothetical protein